MAYMFGNGQFGTIDLNTGVFTIIANIQQFQGLGVVNNKLYGINSFGSLYQVNLANGTITLVGTSPALFPVFLGSTLTGLYAYGANSYLYSIDPGTGAATQIGNGLLPTCDGQYGQFSTNSPTLYFACGANLYTVNVNDGTPTVVGSLGNIAVRALSFINGTLYGAEYPTLSVVSVNRTTGLAVPGVAIRGLAADTYAALAPIIQSPPPTINTSGVVPIFSTSTTIQPGSWISIYGQNFIGATNLWAGDFPTSLGGVTVTINNKPAYLWLVSPGQINLQAPDDTAVGTVPVVVTNAAGRSTATVTLGQYGPSFSQFNTKYAAALVQTPGVPGNSGSGYDLIGPAGAFSFVTRPAKAGETLVLYGVGFGPTNPTVPAGQVFSSVAPSVTLPKVTIGGVPATVSFAGIIQAGLFQLNVIVPNAGSGDQTLEASVGGVITQNGVYITLQ
jgi:uncharacterized protein (TIGR03437 family)